MQGLFVVGSGSTLGMPPMWAMVVCIPGACYHAAEEGNICNRCWRKTTVKSWLLKWSIDSTILTTDTPYLAHEGEIWVVYCEFKISCSTNVIYHAAYKIMRYWAVEVTLCLKNVSHVNGIDWYIPHLQPCYRGIYVTDVWEKSLINMANFSQKYMSYMMVSLVNLGLVIVVP